MSDSSKPVIAITTGDPGGVGPELALKICQDPDVLQWCIPVLYADLTTLQMVSKQLDLQIPNMQLSLSQWNDDLHQLISPAVIDFQKLSESEIQVGKVTADHGAACCQYITQAIDDAMAGKVAAVVTGPIQKEALKAANVPYPGHTELFADRTGTDQYVMMLTSEIITCSFVTAHVGYYEVPQLLSVERILETIQLTHSALTAMRGRKVKLLCCGLNPHAGEHGLFGQSEEELIIEPAIQKARQQGIQVDGPLPPDTCFLPSKREYYDGFICMYHDQGHIPLKALAFDIAVNTTLGLPIVRTSVDHGTAFDIAWQGVASPSSLKHAIQLAVQFATS